MHTYLIYDIFFIQKMYNSDEKKMKPPHNKKKMKELG